MCCLWEKELKLLPETPASHSAEGRDIKLAAPPWSVEPRVGLSEGPEAE
jgi:hypothetical protein